MSVTFSTLNRDGNAGIDTQHEFAQAVYRAYPRLLQLARQRVRNEDQAQDIVQEALLEILERGEVTKNKLHTLCTAVIEQCKHFKASEGEKLTCTQAQGEEHQAISLEDRPSPAISVLRCLSDSERQALELHFLGGLTIGETARTLGLPRSELFACMQTTLRTLEQLLQA